LSSISGISFDFSTSFPLGPFFIFKSFESAKERGRCSQRKEKEEEEREDTGQQNFVPLKKKPINPCHV
jgi:hypothetical protein